MDQLTRDYLEEQVAKQVASFYKAFGLEPPGVVMAIKRGNTNEVTRKIGRSKYGTDVMWRLWDEHNHVWVTVNSRSIWASKKSVEKIRDALITKGRNPDTISVERVFVEVK